MTWYLTRKKETQSDQQSFVGGKPSLPVGMGLPICKLCDESQTFMFQVAFPVESAWAGKTLACFFCTKCVDERFLIPEMLSNHHNGSDISGEFLTSYQRNFAFFVFDTNEARQVDAYTEQVEFASLVFSTDPQENAFGQVGGEPTWVLDDESPASHESTIPMGFLLGLNPNLRFDIVEGALPQVELDLFGKPSSSPLGYYQLFLGNATYLFGTLTGTPQAYAITQV